MGVSLETYRARIGLFHPSASSSSEFKPNVFISKSSACALQFTVKDIMALCYMLTLVNTLLVICGDIELNPGPGDIPNSDHTRYFSFCHANMRSIKRCPEKLDHIKAELSGTYDVITISETWLSPEDKLDQHGNPMYALDGYHPPVRRDRIGRQGGGVLAWVSENLTFKRMHDLEVIDIELMSLELRCKNNKALFLVAYRTNEQEQFWDRLQECYNRAIAAGYSYIILTGDLNADPSTKHGESLLSFIEDNNLTKHINEPTRITETTRSELDQIISNCDNMISNISVTTPVSYNDHHTVSGIIKFKIRRAKAYQRLVWHYGLANFDYFRSKLNIIDWDSCFDSGDVDLVAQKGTDMLINVALECIPNKKVTIRPWDKPFYNGYLRRLRRAKDRAHRLAKYDNTPEAWDIFRDHRRQYFSEIKRLKLETHNKLLANMGESLISNPRKWWSLSKKLLCKQSSSIPAIIIDGNTISADEEKAQAFNEYFIQCSTLDESNATLPSIHPLTESTMESMETSVDAVNKCLSKLDTKAFGPDAVSPRLLKEGAVQLAPVLCRLFNMSLNSGKFPKLWKRANVIPLFKKNDKASISNYRPVSLLSSVGKVFEKLVFNKLFDYFQRNFLNQGCVL